MQNLYHLVYLHPGNKASGNALGMLKLIFNLEVINYMPTMFPGRTGFLAACSEAWTARGTMKISNIKVHLA